MKTQTLITALALAFAGLAHGASDRLAPGVLVDADAGRVVVADAAGFAQAVTLADGRSAWISQEPAYPLLETAGRLLALGRIETKGVGLLLLLDPATGALFDRVAFDVPEHVAASIVSRPKARFNIEAHATEDGARLYWREVAQPLRGAVYGDGSDEARITEGAFDLVLDANRSLAIPLRGTVAAPIGPTPDLLPAERLPALGERQYRGMGDNAAMSAAPQHDAAFGTRWQWTLQARGAERAVAGPALPYAYLPFAMLGNTLVYRTEPVTWRDANGRETGYRARLVAYDLARAEDRWYFDVLDTIDRGPLPP